MLVNPIPITVITLSLATTALPALAAHGEGEHMQMMDQMPAGLMIPEMNAERGRDLFLSKGCVVCHSINDVGGEDAPMLDAETMDAVMNPFDFAARMWRGAAAMVEMQEDELGGQIELDGQELADIIAFVHDPEEQAKLSRDDIPKSIAMMMHHESEGDHHEEGEMGHHDEKDEGHSD